MSDAPYTLITGASSGIGAALAGECAQRKMNLVLVSLPNENLSQFGIEVAAKYEVNVLCFETDLSEHDSCEKILQFVNQNKIRINILVNNAGIGSVGLFLDFTVKFYSKQVTVNAIAPVLLTRLLLPMLLKEPEAYILNVSSLGSFFNIPNKEVYCASKSFVFSFSNSLRETLRDTNISVSVVCPGPVNTNDRLLKAHQSMKGLARKAVLSPEAVAAYSIRCLLKKKKLILPGKLNQISLWLNRLVPHPVKRRLFLKEMKRQAELASAHSLD